MEPSQNAQALANATLQWMRSPLNLGGCGVDPDDKTFKAVEVLLEKIAATTSDTNPWPTVTRQSIGEALIGKHKEKSGYRKAADPVAVATFLNSREEGLRASKYFQAIRYFPAIQITGKRDKGFRLIPQPITNEAQFSPPTFPVISQNQIDADTPATGSVLEPSESPSDPDQDQNESQSVSPAIDCIIYTAQAPHLNIAGRFRYGSGFLSVRSVAWSISFAKTIFLILACAFVASLATLSWWSGFERDPIKTTQFVVLAAVLIAAVWYTQLRPWDRLMRDRIQKMDDIWMKWSEYSCEIEMSVANDRRQFRAVRYEATCSICAGTVRLAEGRREFHDRLVGRCRESPREHVYSFDRVTLIGHPLRQLRHGYISH